jgi:N-acetylneuraminic acid mutarotase
MLRELKAALPATLFLALTAFSCIGVAHKEAPDDGTVTVAPNMKSARFGHTSTLLPNGDVLIAGGMSAEGNTTNTVEIYSPAADAFRLSQPMSEARAQHTATLLPDGKVLIAGGYNGNYLASAEIYDPRTGRLAPTGLMTMPRSGHVAVSLKDGKILLAGGVGTGWTFLASAELYDPSTGKFTPTASMSTPRDAHTATLLKSGKVLVTGGHKDRREQMTIYSSAEVYDPDRGTFSATGNMTAIRHKHAAALLPNGHVIIVGGSDKREWDGRYASAEIYDPAKGAFRAIGNMNIARFKFADAVVALKDGKILVAGGGDRVELYDPTANTFKFVSGKVDAARFFSVATVLRDGRVFITGGYDDRIQASASAWMYKA